MCKWGTDKQIQLNRPRPVSGRVVIEVDACIAPLVQMLQDYGVVTTGCCCGHGKAPGWVSYEDERGVSREIPLKVAEVENK